jgi:hypothetical protein
MPASYEINLSLRLVESQASGMLTEADLSGHFHALKIDPQFNPDFRQLWDLRLVTRFDVSPEFIQAYASQSIFAPNSRRAFIVPQDEGFGLARIFAALSEYFGHDAIEIFRDHASALRWLESPPGPGAPPARTGPKIRAS